MDTNTNMFQMYQNSGYNNTRNRKRTLILDVDDQGDPNLGKDGTFKINLFEPLIIDKHSEVYLDNFTSYNSNLASYLDLTAFCLKINEFNMNSNVASLRSGGTIFNSLVIPNEHRNPDNYQTSVVHKGKKFNYVCDINPGTISSLSGKITDLAGNPAFHSTNSDIFTYTFFGIDATKINRELVPGPTTINSGDSFTDITGATGVGGATITGTFPVTTNLESSTTLHFTTNGRITHIGEKLITTDSNIPDNISGTETGSGAGNDEIKFDIGSNDLIITNVSSSTDNPAMTIIEGHGRFIAEFSIISRE